MERIYIVLPAYNEEANIEDVVKKWGGGVTKQLINTGVDASLVIANDGSKDHTLAKLEELSSSHPYLVALDKPNSGHGATLMHLYRYAIDHNADYIFQTDSDGQTNPDEFWQFWNEREKYDLQVGHRNTREDGFSRIVVTKVLKAVVRLSFGVSVIDANTPFRLFNVKKMADVLSLIPQDFFLANVAMSAIAVKNKKHARWLPITFRPRQGGVNSINLRRIFKIGIKALGDFKKINQNLNNKKK